MLRQVGGGGVPDQVGPGPRRMTGSAVDLWAMRWTLCGLLKYLWHSVPYFTKPIRAVAGEGEESEEGEGGIGPGKIFPC